MKKYFAIALVSAMMACTGYYYLHQPKQVEKSALREDEKIDNEAWDALQFISRAASFPNADIPADGYAKAEATYRTKFATANQRTSNASPWQSIGPNNLGGRTLCIAFDPLDTATIWLGSASGGLWKSTTGGNGPQAWTYVPTGYPVRGVSSIVINHNNPNEMYIGTGEVHTHASAVNGLLDRPTQIGRAHV